MRNDAMRQKMRRSILGYLEDNGPASSRTITDYLSRNGFKQMAAVMTVSHMLTAMEKDGLLDKDDGRVCIWSLRA